MTVVPLIALAIGAGLLVAGLLVRRKHAGADDGSSSGWSDDSSTDCDAGGDGGGGDGGGCD